MTDPSHFHRIVTAQEAKAERDKKKEEKAAKRKVLEEAHEAKRQEKIARLQQLQVKTPVAMPAALAAAATCAVATAEPMPFATPQQMPPLPVAIGEPLPSNRD